MSSHGSKKVIIAALIGNLAIALVKTAAAFITGSAAMLAEAVHSAADTGNQLLLIIGLRLSKRRADESHSFGYGMELYFWPFVVALTMFSLGAIFSVVEGVHKLQHPGLPKSYLTGYVVLVFSVVFEAFSLKVAWQEFSRLRKGKGFFAAARATRDPTVFVVLFEDIAALLGLLVALAGLALTQITQNPLFDASASIVIGLLLGGVAIFLGYETRSLLIGESASPEDLSEIKKLASGISGFGPFTELRTMHMAPDEIVVECAVRFDDAMTMGQVRRAIDEFETALHGANPKITHITVEPSRGP
ncbi:MAG: cation diffusion facilitator family transporter [Thermoanaerobaculia bacterium]